MGQSGYFAGSSHGNLPIGNIPTGDNSRFMECWFKIGWNVTSRTALLHYGSAGNAFSLHLESSCRIRCGANSKVMYSPNYAYSLNVWNHVGFGYSGSYFYIYLNNSIVYTSSLITATYTTSFTSLFLAHEEIGITSPCCLIDNIRMYNRCISLDEFKKSHKVTNGLLASYNFNLDNNDVIHDVYGWNGSWVNGRSLSNDSVDFDRYVLHRPSGDNLQWVSGMSLTPLTLSNIDQVVTASPNGYLTYIQTGDRILRVI